MSWFRDKAAECGRLAKEATRAVDRDKYAVDAKLWLQIAYQEEAAEDAVRAC